GYAAGSVGTIISNPADNIVASLNNKKAGSLKLVGKLDCGIYLQEVFLSGSCSWGLL
ncbi:hypothetical protein Ccrd_025905, partial [Cynara cardunculus var. scolymus]